MVKEKPNSIRTYDADGFRKRAACLCVRDETEQEILLVSGSKHPDKWVVPGGGIEPTEDTGVAAVREAMEEAGVNGILGRFLGIFENRDRMTRTSVYVLIVTDLLDDWEDARTLGRQRKWFALEDAYQQLGLHKPVQQSYIELIKGAKVAAT
ncbi:Diphosphoinositol polyphosphate phosphohydrolase 1 [Lamellibrachia satsuma]|nr:Diphosphoinositol polyphosphate phosphohydrolase 1 [Lamellibrachia satsuma]